MLHVLSGKNQPVVTLSLGHDPPPTSQWDSSVPNRRAPNSLLSSENVLPGVPQDDGIFEAHEEEVHQRAGGRFGSARVAEPNLRP